MSELITGKAKHHEAASLIRGKASQAQRTAREAAFAGDIDDKQRLARKLAEFAVFPSIVRASMSYSRS